VLLSTRREPRAEAKTGEAAVARPSRAERRREEKSREEKRREEKRREEKGREEKGREEKGREEKRREERGEEREEKSLAPRTAREGRIAASGGGGCARAHRPSPAGGCTTGGYTVTKSQSAKVAHTK